MQQALTIGNDYRLLQMARVSIVHCFFIKIRELDIHISQTRNNIANEWPPLRFFAKIRGAVLAFQREKLRTSFLFAST